jgi:hypothetical protein
MYHLFYQSVTVHSVFTDLEVNSDYFLEQRLPVDLYKGEVWCSL